MLGIGRGRAAELADPAVVDSSGVVWGEDGGEGGGEGGGGGGGMC